MDRVDESGIFQRRPTESPADESEFTFHSSDPKSVIDWILASEDWHIIDYKVIPSLLSDHRMLLAEVQLVSKGVTNPRVLVQGKVSHSVSRAIEVQKGRESNADRVSRQ